eukprot:CAMPEP_0170559964 /NCGR_PEP_ID=MMETSP0211-20121228/46220_1 /TAXON_ID=311385 /ORGANISM="Pseudokeronopsis sp., Strain OXSARD2" /LENGTH=50 /DNA_ID=CAMNT_0010873637 /DNA_START=493 /DNA_END=645 /DNA_ORIENTATION=-
MLKDDDIYKMKPVDEEGKELVEVNEEGKSGIPHKDLRIENPDDDHYGRHH